MHSIRTNDLLTVENLKTYFYTPEGILKAVDEVSFSLKEGECVCIVGESGSGKSTLALSILKLLDESARIEGRVAFNGKNLIELSEDEIRKIRGNEISMIFQNPQSSLNPVMRVGEQIVEQMINHKRMDKKEAKSKAIELLREMGIPDAEKRFGDFPHQLSGGMKQRVMIAMALSCNPKIIIADEPTSALDVTIQAQILDIFKRLKQKGISILFITHDFGIVSVIADRIVVMYAGRVMEKGTAVEILRNPEHPYTVGLLDCLPGTSEKDRLAYIPGTIPSLIEPPEGCVFSPRCRFRFDACSKTPPEYPVSDVHSVACFLFSNEVNG
jgi:peptide/nickel transport system ATP-binding protein